MSRVSELCPPSNSGACIEISVQVSDNRYARRRPTHVSNRRDQSILRYHATPARGPRRCCETTMPRGFRRYVLLSSCKASLMRWNSFGYRHIPKGKTLDGDFRVRDPTHMRPSRSRHRDVRAIFRSPPLSGICNVLASQVFTHIGDNVHMIAQVILDRRYSIRAYMFPKSSLVRAS